MTEHQEIRSFKSESFYVLVLLLVLFIGTFSIYAPRTALYPQESDGAEYATAAVTKSIVHPPGYPVYMTVARSLVNTFPDNPYATLSMFSAFTQSCAVVLLFLIGISLGVVPTLSFVVAFIWATFGPTMRTATDVEVFAFHHLLIGLTILSGLNLRRSSNKNILAFLMFGLSIGLASAHHQTIILWSPFFLWILCSRLSFLPGILGKLKGIILTVCGFFAGFSSYVLLLIGYTNEPVLAFAPPQDLTELYHYIARTVYGTFSLTGKINLESQSYIVDLLKNIAGFSPLFLLSIPLLFFVITKKEIGEFLAIFGTLILHGIFAYLLILPSDQNFTAEWVSRFYPLVLFPLATALLFVLSKIELSQSVQQLLLIGLIAPAALKINSNLSYADARHDETTHFEITQILKELPDNAIFIASTDRLSLAMSYATAALKQRPDLIVVVKYLINSKGYRSTLVARSPHFNDLKLEDPLLEQIVDRFYKENRYVFSSIGDTGLSNYTALPLGVSWQWIKREDLPPRVEVTKHLLSYCANWPEDLTYVPWERKTSRLILGELFLWPLVNHLSLVENEDVAASLSAAIKSFDLGDLRSARSECLKGYQILTGSDDPTFDPYPIHK